MKIVFRIISVCMIAVIAFANFGCSAFKSSTQTIAVTCNPSDSILMINGQKYHSPAQVRVKRNRDVAINCYKEGYFSYQRTVGNHFATTGVLDAIGTALILVPGIGLFCSGAWDLDDTEVNIELIPNQATNQNQKE